MKNTVIQKISHPTIIFGEKLLLMREGVCREIGVSFSEIAGISRTFFGSFFVLNGDMGGL